MINFSYTLSPFLKREIEGIEKTRNKILTTLISPQRELELRWETKVARIYYSQVQEGKDVKRGRIHSILTQSKQNLEESEQEIINFRNAYDYIRQFWTMSDDHISAKAIIKMAKFFNSDFDIKNEKELNAITDFIQLNPEHPVVQSAIAFVLLYHVLGQDPKNLRLSSLFSYLILTKGGYDLKQLLVLEEIFAKDQEHQKRLLDNSIASKNLSDFLEYYTQNFAAQAEKTFNSLTSRKDQSIYPDSYFKLNERQKEILGYLDQPGKKITNKMVQKMFKVSQITASRDLSNLTDLNLVYVHGKGRSVYYTLT